MSLRDWLLAAWIFEEIFEDGPRNRSHKHHCDCNSSYDYDTYDDDF